MKLSKLIKQLTELKTAYGDVEVMVNDNNCDGPYKIERVLYEVAGPDDYPEEYKMPEGFRFVEISG